MEDKIKLGRVYILSNAKPKKKILRQKQTWAINDNYKLLLWTNVVRQG